MDTSKLSDVVIVSSPDRAQFVQSEYERFLSEVIAKPSTNWRQASITWAKEHYETLSDEPLVLVDRDSAFMKRIRGREVISGQFSKISMDGTVSARSLSDSDRQAIVSRLANVVANLPRDAEDFNFALVPSLEVEVTKGSRTQTISIPLLTPSVHAAMREKLFEKPLRSLPVKNGTVEGKPFTGTPGFLTRGFITTKPESLSCAIGLEKTGAYLKSRLERAKSTATQGLAPFLRRDFPQLAKELDGKTSVESLPPVLRSMLLTTLSNTYISGRPPDRDSISQGLDGASATWKVNVMVRFADSDHGAITVPGL